MHKNIEKIKKKLKSKFYYDYEIYKHTWFKTGGKAYIFCLVYNEKELEIILNSIGFRQWLKSKQGLLFVNAAVVVMVA